MVAARHGWSLDALSIFELIPAEASLGENRELTIFQPAELELSETTKLILDQVKAIDPVRIVFDGLSEMRLLAQDALRYRRQILALKQFFAGRRSTVLLLDDLTSQATDQQLHSIAHGVVTLEQMALDYGAERRRLRVVKMRGIAFRGGYHDLTIARGGLTVFPRLVAAEHHNAVLGEYAQREWGAGCDAGRRARAWHHRPVDRWRRSRQVVHRAHLCGLPRRSAPRTSRRFCPGRTRASSSGNLSPLWSWQALWRGHCPPSTDETLRLFHSSPRPAVVERHLCR